MKNGRQWEQFATVGLFLAVMTVFCAGSWITQSKDLAMMERLGLRKMPSINEGFAKFTENFDSYFNARALLRKNLISARNLLKIVAFGVSGSPQVLLGNQGWLFYTGDRAIQSFMNVEPLTVDQLAQWKAGVDARAQWLAKRNIKFVMCVPPDKYTVYPEMLPPFLKPVGSKSRLDQLVDCLRGDSNVTFVDVRPTLLAHKKDGQLFFKNDTHWNDEGAFLAYTELMRPIHQWFPAVQPLRRTDMIHSQRKSIGDLAQMLELKPFFREQGAKLTPGGRANYVIAPNSTVQDFSLLGTVPNNLTKPYISAKKADATLPRLLLFHDSFMVAMMPWLPEAGSKTEFWWQDDLNPDIIEREKPDAVVWEITERFLMAPPPSADFPNGRAATTNSME
jgi:alginate O-acetyltransferase complex protein AlgJ